MRIALDAMGGDSAPQVEVEGAIQSIPLISGHEVVLVGDEAQIKAAAAKLGGFPPGITIRHASQAIRMEDHPVDALRHKPDSSIIRCVEMAKNGEVDAVVSAGNTGGVVAVAMLKWGMLEGVRRPGIAVSIPTRTGGHVLVIDCGANVKCTPEHLLQYGVMASAYTKWVFRKAKPNVGLLNIGAERTKGNALVQGASDLFEKAQFHYIGFVEGREVFHDVADVVVCEGFVGNVLLKVSEGMVETIIGMIKHSLRRTLRRRIGAMLCKYAMIDVAAKIDPSELAGAPLLGVDGNCVICHGGSNSRAIAVAIRRAVGAATHHVNQHIVADLQLNGTT